jgi:hypothetical protein
MGPGDPPGDAGGLGAVLLQQVQRRLTAHREVWLPYRGPSEGEPHMTDEPRSESRDVAPEAEGYEPPRVEDIPAEDSSAVTAPGVFKTPLPGAEWRP